MRIAISTEPLWRNRSASRPIPVWMAPVFIVTVMNAPTASTNRKIIAEPYRNPCSSALTKPRSLSIP